MEKVIRKQIVPKMGSRKDKRNVSRQFFSFGDNWTEYIFKKPLIVAKKMDEGGILNDGTEVTIYKKGDYMVNFCNDIHRIKPNAFNDNFITKINSTNKIKTVAYDNFLKILPKGVTENVQISGMSLKNRLKFLKTGKLDLKITLQLNKDETEHKYFTVSSLGKSEKK